MQVRVEEAALSNVNHISEAGCAHSKSGNFDTRDVDFKSDRSRRAGAHSRYKQTPIAASEIVNDIARSDARDSDHRCDVFRRGRLVLSHR